MIKLTYLIRKRPDLSAEDFLAFWRETHARLVESHAQTLRVKRYAMSARVETVCNACSSKAREVAICDYDGVIEFWWDTLEDHQAGAGSPAGLAAIDDLVAAERRFIDLSKSACFFTTEEVMFDHTGRGTAKTPAKASKAKPQNSKHELSNETSFPALIK